MRFIIVAVAAAGLSACAPAMSRQEAAASYGISDADLAQCQYEAYAAGLQRRGLLDGPISEAHALRLCISARQAATPARPYSPPAATADGIPGYCSDPTVTNPNLVAECNLLLSNKPRS